MIGRILVRTMPRLRREAESMMIDTIRITRGDRTIYEGKGRIQTHQPHPSTPVAAGHTFVEQLYRVDIPAEAPGVRVGDVAEVIASVLNATLTGRQYTIRGPHGETFNTAQRFIVTEEVSGHGSRPH